MGPSIRIGFTTPSDAAFAIYLWVHGSIDTGDAARSGYNLPRVREREAVGHQMVTNSLIRDRTQQYLKDGFPQKTVPGGRVDTRWDGGQRIRFPLALPTK